ncbi:MAG TPA: glycosyltransferase family 4 protein [Verrucomicrobiae bacterium]|nr:glycosyltransferase family 4 protein [Verrucomicrobiae bacterium]
MPASVFGFFRLSAFQFQLSKGHGLYSGFEIAPLCRRELAGFGRTSTVWTPELIGLQMRVLIIHPESEYFAGAETMLGYFLTELARTDCKVAVAAVRKSRVAGLLPAQTIPVWLEPCPAFSPFTIWRQAKSLKALRAEFDFDLVHGWAARDWELSAFIGWLSRRPAIGTLHDHPEASFIRRKRRRLMRWCARFGLKRIVCVSGAVRDACADAGYPASKLQVVRNGLPSVNLGIKLRAPGPFRIGFLGMFSERKGLRTLFQIADALPTDTAPWELLIAGGASDKAGKMLADDIQRGYGTRPWWSRVRWLGWVESPQNFLRSVDLLLLPSSEFDPFPTVLLEAGQSGVPVLASRVGGVAEIILENKTGWLFEPGRFEDAAKILQGLIASPKELQGVGNMAHQRVLCEFCASKMVAQYQLLYSNLLAHV